MTGHTSSSDKLRQSARLRQEAIRIFQTGITAADPYLAVQRVLRTVSDRLEILLDPHGGAVRTRPWRRVHLIAFGKAACTMASAARDIIPENLLTGRGIAVTNYENRAEVDGMEIITAGHPLPDANGYKGARLIAERVSAAGANELVLVLVSGGGSALIPFPVADISLEEKIATTELLLACGADITQINCVRKHLSRLKGGGLARMAFPADVHALILSDVLGDDLSAIASGPTVPDATTFADAIEVFSSRGVWHRVPENVRRHLLAGRDGHADETPKPGDAVFDNVGHTLIGSNRMSLEAVAAAAEAEGFAPHVYSTALCGEARDAAQAFAEFAEQLCLKAVPGRQAPIAIVAGGETTVTLRGGGRGGRNQEMALAFALAAQRLKLPHNWVFLSGGTDGRDGPTDATGGIVDPGSLERISARGIDPAAELDDNDSYCALKSANDLLETGATGTNVADLQVMLIDPNPTDH